MDSSHTSLPYAANKFNMTYYDSFSNILMLEDSDLLSPEAGSAEHDPAPVPGPGLVKRTGMDSEVYMDNYDHLWLWYVCKNVRRLWQR
jgi:hypothetical protein